MCAAVVAAAPAHAESDAGADAGASNVATVPACMLVSKDARYVPYGYNHIVVLKNGCSKPATCAVATDVNPQSIATVVAAGTTVEVVTFSGSPAQVFTPRVRCTL